ncbi:unnamed protein product [Dovyalis caffra]|uniref:Uncharacterized protein n=1 Tax=Dovyalis caffra TaxID=77055 RepID=A0AAV1QX15_9ROSI|nr:unnamed protein product [Dovyalis caffra]
MESIYQCSKSGDSNQFREWMVAQRRQRRPSKPKNQETAQEYPITDFQRSLITKSKELTRKALHLARLLKPIPRLFANGGATAFNMYSDSGALPSAMHGKYLSVPLCTGRNKKTVTVTLLKSHGGLGIRQAKGANSDLIGKLGGEIDNGSNKLWDKIIGISEQIYIIRRLVRDYKEAFAPLLHYAEPGNTRLIYWHPPTGNSWKLNMDGSFLENPGRAIAEVLLEIILD